MQPLLSACPATVKDKAAVYVLEKNGYVKVRDSQNGFTAIVQHSLPIAREPQCKNDLPNGKDCCGTQDIPVRVRCSFHAAVESAHRATGSNLARFRTPPGFDR